MRESQEVLSQSRCNAARTPKNCWRPYGHGGFLAEMFLIPADAK
jgi:hypothetical protein